MDEQVIEYIIDCSTQQAVDRDYEGDLTSFSVPEDQDELRRRQALDRLRALALSDEVIRDLLIVAGLA